MNKQQFVGELSKLRPGSTFLSVMGYRNEYFEIADYNLVFHMSYENALKRSIATLQAYKPTSDLEIEAKADVLSRFKNSLSKAQNTSLEDIDDAYTRFFDDDGNYIKGIKMHTKTETLHLYGLVVHKRVIMPGSYDDKDTRRPLTVAKDKLRRMCQVSKFRQFKMTPAQVDRITVEHLSLLPPV
jgi:hypothetical protein